MQFRNPNTYFRFVRRIFVSRCFPHMSTNSAAERRSYIMRLLHDQGHVSVSSLSDELDVSEVTIRKDMRFLEERELLVRTHGGAVLLDQYVYDLPVEEKTTRNQEEKKRIGEEAAGMVDDGDTLIIDGGSTTLQVARNLRKKKDLIVATASIHIALELLRISGIDIMMLGGMIRSTSASVIGSYAEQMLEDHAFQKLFISGDGFDLDYGMTTTNTMEAHLNRVMMRSAQQTIAVVDSSKIGRRGLSRICDVEQIHTVVIDSGVSEGTVRRLEELGILVSVV